jgi:outer membrane immunogenic protein
MSSNLLRAILATALSVALPATLWAADLKVKKPVYKAPPAPVAMYTDWSGFYVGGHLGYGWADSSSTGTGIGGAGAGPFEAALGTSVGVSPGGWLAGIQFGNNWLYQQYLLGFEVDVGYLGIKGDTTAGSDLARVQYGWYGVLAGRLGVTYDNMLLYAKGGLAMARIANDASNLIGGVVDGADFSTTSGVRTGWALGAGLEYALSRQWSVKGEYLYMDFGSVTSGNADGDTFEHKNSVHTAKLGLNYRFGAIAGPIVAKY